MRAERFLLFSLAAVLLVASGALAHGEEYHEKGLEGSVVALAGDVLTVRTASGPVAVTLTEETSIVSGDKRRGREALQPGSRVTVHGSKLPGGGMVAREVILQDGAGR